MKKKSSIVLFLWLILLSLASISVASSQTVQTNVMLTKVNAAPSKPTVDIEYPEDGALLTTGTHDIKVYAFDSTGIFEVEIKIEGAELGKTQGWVDITYTKSASLYYYSWILGEGDFSITARATNGEGRHADDAVKVTVVSAAPPPTEPVHDVAVTSVRASPTSVTAGEVVTVTVVVENQGTETETFDVTSYYSDSVAIGTATVSILAGATETLTFSWDTTGLEGIYTIKAEASVVPGEENIADNSFTDGTVTVSAPGAPPTATYELFFEIDYMVGHEPTPEVLDYIEWYYMGNNPSGELVSVTFYVSDVPVPLDTSVSDTDFWAIEATYNNLGDDKYTGETANFVSEWKWVLFGTTVEGAPNVVGYTYTLIRGKDLLAGNYIFIADVTGDIWASNNGISNYGAEAVVLMHEMGHSIGVANVHPAFGEIYDPDPSSVMNYLSTANARLYWAWYYSGEYWATRNMEYYTI